jgi:hypothetical protein
MTLPSASRTACEVKFSEGIKLMKCFWRFFSYGDGVKTVHLAGVTLSGTSYSPSAGY